MFGKSGLNNFMKQAQKMREKITKVQEEISNIEVIGESGAGVVKVTINGAHNCKKIEIDPELIQRDEKEILEDLITAAFNDAIRCAEEMQKEKMGDISKINGMGFPFGFKSPF